MAETWYVVPAEYAMRELDGEGEEDVEPTMVFCHPVAEYAWPTARTLPRRLTGKAKK